MQLYDQDLLERHIQACLGVPLITRDGQLKSSVQTGYQIVYAEGDVIIPDRFEWPEGCMDLPKPGNICHTGQPICSIIAHQKESASVAQQLLTKQQLIINKLERF
jgi:methenyltetrahydromethanopterin cyclohydrolase